MKLKDLIQEKIIIDVEIGDTILTGKFRNKKTVVKTIDIDENGQLVINGKKMTTFRVPKKVEEATEKRDDHFRKVSHELLKKLQNKIDDRNLWHPSRRFKGILIHGKDVDKKRDDVIFRLTGVGMSNYSIGTHTSGKYVIFLPVLTWSDVTNRQKFTMHDLLYNSDQFKLKVEWNYVHHELVHLFDRLRSSYSSSTTSLRKTKGKEAYYNSPREFNAYYQQGVSKWEKEWKRDTNKANYHAGKNFQEFFDNHGKDYWMGDFLKAMTPETKKRFYKRASQAYISFKKKYVK